MAFNGELTLEEVNMNRKEHGLEPLESLSAVRLSPREAAALVRKRKFTNKLLDYLGNSENKPVKSRTEYQQILKIKSPNYLLRIFSDDELSDIEKKGLELRRLQYSNKLALVDDSLLEKAAEGKAPEAKLAYQRFEGWSEKVIDNGDARPLVVIQIRNQPQMPNAEVINVPSITVQKAISNDAG
jgi:hypothetical protein